MERGLWTEEERPFLGHQFTSSSLKSVENTNETTDDHLIRSSFCYFSFHPSTHTIPVDQSTEVEESGGATTTNVDREPEIIHSSTLYAIF